MPVDLTVRNWHNNAFLLPHQCFLHHLIFLRIRKAWIAAVCAFEFELVFPFWIWSFSYNHLYRCISFNGTFNGKHGNIIKKGPHLNSFHWKKFSKVKTWSQALDPEHPLMIFGIFQVDLWSFSKRENYNLRLKPGN